MGNAAAHMARGNMPGRIAHMAGLVVEEEVGFELAQKPALGQSAEEHGLIDIDLPVHQRIERAFMGRGAARRDQGRAHAHAGHIGLLQSVQGGQQGLERAFGQRLGGFLHLMLLESLQALGLEDALGLIGNYVWRNASQNFHFRGK